MNSSHYPEADAYDYVLDDELHALIDVNLTLRRAAVANGLLCEIGAPDLSGRDCEANRAAVSQENAQLRDMLGIPHHVGGPDDGCASVVQNSAEADTRAERSNAEPPVIISTGETLTEYHQRIAREVLKED